MRGLLVALGLVVSMAGIAEAQDGPAAPPIRTLLGATAHTLDRGEVRIGDVRLILDPLPSRSRFPISQLKWLDVEYGLTDRLQVGTTPWENVREGPNAWAKFQAVQGPAFGLAVPLAVTTDWAPFGVRAGSGLVASWRVGGGAALHAGLRFWALSGRIQLSRASLALSLARLPRTRLMAEAAVWPLAVEVGALGRLGPLHLEMASRLVDAGAPNVNLALTLSARF